MNCRLPLIIGFFLHVSPLLGASDGGSLALVQNKTRNNIVIKYAYNGKVAQQAVPPSATVSLGLLSKVSNIRYNIYGQYKASLAGKDVLVNKEQLKKLAEKDGFPTFVINSYWVCYSTSFTSSRPDACNIISMFPRAFRELSYKHQLLSALGIEGNMVQVSQALGNIAIEDTGYLIMGVTKPENLSGDIKKIIGAVYEAKVDTVEHQWFNHPCAYKNDYMKNLCKDIFNIAHTLYNTK